jgi:hypothetical protein
LVFLFELLNPAIISDSAHFHVYKLNQDEGDGSFRLGLDTRFSTDANGIAECLGLQTDQRMELEQIVKLLGTKISQKTLFTL